MDVHNLDRRDDRPTTPLADDRAPPAPAGGSRRGMRFVFRPHPRPCTHRSGGLSKRVNFEQACDQGHWPRRAWMFTISTIATPDPHHLLTLANDMPPPGVPGGARFVFRSRPQPCTHRSGVIGAATSTTLVTKDTGLGAY